MKKRRGLICSLIILIFAVGITVTVVVLRNKNKEKEPRTGLHFIEARGTLYVKEQEDVTIPLLVYYYNGSRKDDVKVIGQYKKFALVTAQGEEIPFDVTKEVLNGFMSGDDTRIKQNEFLVTVQNEMLQDGELTITGLRYCDEKGKVNELDLGKITVVEQSDVYDELSITGVKAVWARYALPIMKYYEIWVDNQTKEDVTITNIEFGEDSLVTEPTEAMVVPNEYIYAGVDVAALSQEGCFVYYLKPLVRMMVGDEVKIGVQDNISQQRYVGRENELYNYFLEKQ